MLAGSGAGCRIPHPGDARCAARPRIAVQAELSVLFTPRADAHQPVHHAVKLLLYTDNWVGRAGSEDVPDGVEVW